MAGTLTCECGKEDLNESTIKMHQRSKACQKARGVVLTPPSVPKVQEELDPDLQSIVDDVKGDPRHRASAVRHAFAARKWPNSQHPGTVRDFLKKHKIPILDTPRHTPAFEVGQHMQRRVEELAEQ